MNESEKLLKNGRLSVAYLQLDGEIQSLVLDEFNNLLRQNTAVDSHTKKHMHESILPAIAVYRVLLEKGLSKRESFQAVRNSVLETAKPMKDFFESLGKLPFFFPLFRIMCPLSTMKPFCGTEWKFVWQKNTPSTIEWECHNCIYCNTFKKYGVRELTTIFCESDDIVYGSLKHAQWARTQTMGRGAKYCDFRFYNKRKDQ